MKRQILAWLMVLAMSASTFSGTSVLGQEGTAREWMINGSFEGVDLDALDALVQEAKKIDGSLYTAESVEVFAQLLSDAEGLLTDPEANQGDIDTTVQSLNTAIQNLVLNARGELNAALKDAAELNADLYTEESYAALISACEAGQAVFESDDLDDRAYQEAKDTICDAMDALVLLNLLKNGSFESDIWTDDNGWNPVAASWEGDTKFAQVNVYAKAGSCSANYYSPVDNEFTLTQTVSLDPGQYTLSGAFSGGDSIGILSVSGETLTDTFQNSTEMRGWNLWDSCSVVFSVEEACEVTVTVKAVCTPGGWGYIDTVELRSGNHSEESGRQPSEKISIEPIEGLSPDFIRGVDISSVLSLEAAGVKYYNTEGQEEDLFKIMKDAGVNYIRVRVWNDPYNAEGNAYGGGNNDVASAVEIGRRAAQYGMKLLVDFHYSDFWASPSIQQKPKAWAEYSDEELCTAIAEFTADSLRQIREGGADIGMVQIGNETSNHLLQVKDDWDLLSSYFAAGCDAVRTFDASIAVMIHFGGSSSGQYLKYMKQLQDHNVDYDIVGISWYPFYNQASLETFKTYMDTAASNFGKQVIVAENSYPMQFDDSDGHPETFGDDRYLNSYEKMKAWAVSAQGQAQQVRDVIEAVSQVQNGAGIGYFYWEPAWITVGDTTGLFGDAWEEQYAKNQELWETYDCGWASSYAADYYSKKQNVDKYWGGSSWDNQAMFGADGQALDSVNVFRYIYEGSEAPNRTIESYVRPVIQLKQITTPTATMSEDDIWDEIWQNIVPCTFSDGETENVYVRRIVNKGVEELIADYQAGKLGKYTLNIILMDKNNTVIEMDVIISADTKYVKSCKLAKSSYTYDGKAKKPEVTVINKNGKTLIKDQDYEVAYSSGCKLPGTYKVTINGIGDYSFAKTLKFTIAVKGTTIARLTRGKSSFKVKYRRQKVGTTGYQVQYARSSRFRNAVTKTYKGHTSLTRTISRLKSKKTYYVRVRTYVSVKGKKYYSRWSTKTSVKTK